MKKSLLICIAAHYNPERVEYLEKIVKLFLTDYRFRMSVEIFIDTNTSDLCQFNIGRTTVFVHEDLEHPFHLTCMHKQHFKDNIDKFENFMYIEDDMYLPVHSYLNYIKNFNLLWPQYVPSFVRIEVDENLDEFVSDVVNRQPLNIIEIGGKQFAPLPFPENYHAFWIMPGKELKEAMLDNFTWLSDYRERNAMYPGWGLGKITLVEIEYRMVSKKCYSYHLPNNYIKAPMPNAKIRIENTFL